MEQLLHELQIFQEELTVQNLQLREAQAELQETRDKYADLYHFAPVPILTLDANGIVLELNLAASALLAKPRAEVEGTPLMRFASPDGRRQFLEFMRRCRAYTAGDPPTVAVVLVTASGEREVEIVCSPRPGDPSAKPLFLAAITDLTERNRLERARREAEEEREALRQKEAVAAASAEAKDQFLARLSHELRTPLTPVLAILTDPKLTSEAPPDLRELLNMMRRDIELEIRLIDDLLDLTRIARNGLVIERHPVDVHNAIDDVVSMLSRGAAARGVDLVTRRAAAASSVIGDATRLRQVLWNLVNNGLKFTPRGGRVTTATANTPDGGLEMQVIDSGRGMDAATVRTMFGSDERAAAPLPPEAGLGLGLAICRGIVQAHGGSIRGSSAGIGRGSVFTIVLPSAFDADHERSGQAAAEPASGGPAIAVANDPSSVHILLVEDDEDTAAMLSALLELHRYRVDVAHSVADAVRKSAVQRWDLLISDIRLPDGTGLDLMQRLGEQRARHAIAMSGFGSPEDVRRSLDAGFDEHMVKPLDMGTLLDTIGRYCGVRAASG